MGISENARAVLGKYMKEEKQGGPPNTLVDPRYWRPNIARFLKKGPSPRVWGGEAEEIFCEGFFSLRQQPLGDI